MTTKADLEYYKSEAKIAYDKAFDTQLEYLNTQAEYFAHLVNRQILNDNAKYTLNFRGNKYDVQKVVAHKLDIKTFGNLSNCLRYGNPFVEVYCTDTERVFKTEIENITRNFD